MTKKRVLLLALGLCLLAGLFPPWLDGYHHPNGYSFVFSPSSGCVKIDPTRVALEWLCIGIAGAIGWMLAPEKREPRELKPGWLKNWILGGLSVLFLGYILVVLLNWLVSL